MPTAITRAVSSRFAEAEITHIQRIPIDVGIARTQHDQYLLTLKSHGYEVIELPAEDDLPDSVFVEDTAVILPELGIITLPGANSRKPEIASIAEILRDFRELVFINPPASLDGGDVLVLGKQVYIGLSSRSNQAVIGQMNGLLGKHGYHVHGINLHDCLHLKSAVTSVDHDSLLINPDWVDKSIFKGFNLIEVNRSEPLAANSLPIGDTILFPAAFPNTRQKLEQKGFKLSTIDVSEIAKAEGGLTCCSLIIP